MKRKISENASLRVVSYINDHKEKYSLFSLTESLGLHGRVDVVGNNYFICCPFHEDNTPSFSIDNVHNIFKCFSCGRGGSYLKFLLEYKIQINNESFSKGLLLDTLLKQDKEMQEELNLSTVFFTKEEKAQLVKDFRHFRLNKTYPTTPQNYIQLANEMNKRKDFGVEEKLYVMGLIQKGAGANLIYRQVFLSGIFDKDEKFVPMKI